MSFIIISFLFFFLSVSFFEILLLLNEPNLLGNIGRRERIPLENISSEGVHPFSKGVVLCASSPKYMSSLHFFRILFATFTIAFAAPLLWEYLGDEVTCSKSYSFAKRRNLNANCVPQSLLTVVFGIPYLAKVSLHFVMISCSVKVFN